MFFLISGVFFKTVHLKRKLKHLMAPYISFYVLAFVAYVLKAIGKNESVIWESFLIPFIGGTRDYQNTPLWFLVSLSEIMIVSYFIIRKYNKTIVILLSFVAALIASKMPKYSISIPYYIDVSLVCLPFFLAGYFLKKIILNKVNLKCSLMMIAISLILYFVNPVFTNVSTNYLPQGYFLFYFVSISGTIGIVGLCHALKDNIVISGIQFCGRNSLIILCTHMIFMTVDSVCMSLIKNTLCASLVSFACLIIVETCVCYLIKRYMKFTLGQ